MMKNIAIGNELLGVNMKNEICQFLDKNKYAIASEILSIKFARNKFFRFIYLNILLFSCILKTGDAQAQDIKVMPGNNDLITVFLDFRDHQQYIREMITFVNYVRDRELSQVHIMMTRHSSGSAGDNYEISFIGRESYEGMNNDITYWDQGTNTDDETRQGLVKMISMGLSPYVANTNIANHVTINTNNNLSEEKIPVEDPWNKWVIEIYGGANLKKESSKSSFDSRWGLYVDKMSDDWKIRMRPYFNVNKRTFIHDDDDIISLSHRNGFDGYLIKSINQHWSAGLFVNMLSSTFHNMKFNIEAAPGVEYSFYPYPEASRKAITLVYRLGVGYHNYIEETLFFKKEENLANHSLNLSVDFQQPWGSFRADISGSHYFHDFKANRVSLSSSLDFRIFKGLSLSLGGDFDLINDLVALPAGDLSLEDILLQQRRQATNYQMYGFIGFTYKIGSQFSNVVNTRF